MGPVLLQEETGVPGKNLRCLVEIALDVPTDLVRTRSGGKPPPIPPLGYANGWYITLRLTFIVKTK